MKDIKKELQTLINKMRFYRMTEEEQKLQLISFAYGNLKIEDQSVTKQDVIKAYEDLYESK